MHQIEFKCCWFFGGFCANLQGQLRACTFQEGIQGEQVASMSILDPTDISEAMDRGQGTNSSSNLMTQSVVHVFVSGVSGWYHGVFWEGVFLFS